VVGVLGLEARQPGIRHLFDQVPRERRLAVPHAGMRHDRRTSRLSDQTDRVDGGKSVLGNVGGPVVADPDIERLFLGRDVALLDERLRNVRTNDVASASDLEHALPGNGDAELAQALDHELAAAQTLVAETTELALERAIADVDPVRQDVNAPAVVLGRELDAGDDVDAGTFARGPALLEPLGRVVIRDRDHVDVALGCETNQLGRGERTVGTVGVRVEIDP
jgi:hypothetical protein